MLFNCDIWQFFSFEVGLDIIYTLILKLPSPLFKYYVLFSPVSAIALIVSWWILDLANSNVSWYVSLKQLCLSLEFKTGWNCLHVDGQKLHKAKITLYTVYKNPQNFFES